MFVGWTDPKMSEVVVLFGLGEAGTAFAIDLVSSGITVRGYDPAAVATPAGTTRFDDPADAALGADMVMAMTAGADAEAALRQVEGRIGPSTVYADLSTAPPSSKRALSDIATRMDMPFADVALLGPVSGKGLAVPSITSGPGATAYAEFVNALGGQVEVVGPEAGIAAARKLMRSIVTKGLAGLYLESLELGAAMGDLDWLRSHLDSELTAWDASFVERLLAGTDLHAARRIEEMVAARQMLLDMGIEPALTNGTIERLRMVMNEGMPAVTLR